jgi:hypothetical protein
MRDFVTEMRKIIDDETSAGPYVSGVVAERIVAECRAGDPELLAGWLDQQAVTFLRQAINARDCSARTYARTATRRGQFATDASAYTAGDVGALRGWLGVPFVISSGGARKQLADLTSVDLEFVASEYDRRSDENRMMAIFLRAMQKKVGDGTVGQSYSDAELISMWKSLRL